LSPGSPSIASGYLSTVHELVNAFINGRLASAGPIQGQKPDEGKFEKGAHGEMAGERGSVVLHLLGKDTAPKPAH
jgi:hypothetical protein